jgi:hypothetical protein
MGIDGMPRKTRTLEDGLVSEAPKSSLLSGNELRSGMKLVDSRREIRKVISHGTDEVLVILDDNTTRRFSRNEPEAEVFDT